MGPSGIAGCAALTGALTLGAGGSLTAGLKSAAFAFASAAVFTGVGEMLGSSPNSFVKAAVHGVAGGALSVAQGGNFLQGFAANAVGAFAGGASDGAFGPGGASPDIIAHTLIVAAAGCASASITGGKCADAAVTAAFANIYNAWGGGTRNEEMRRWIAESASSKIGDESWAARATNGNFGEGSNKCNLFVYDAIDGAGLPPPERQPSWYSRGGGPITAGTWADPSTDIPGWTVVTHPQPGDVGGSTNWSGMILNRSPYNPFGATGHTAIVGDDGAWATGTSSAEPIQSKYLPDVFQHGVTTYRRYTGNTGR